MTVTVDRAAFTTAERLAPHPDRADSPVADWIRHYAALALAAHETFQNAIHTLPRNPAPNSRPELGYLVMIADAATAAAAGLVLDHKDMPTHLWDLSTAGGALNGENVDWLADTLAGLGVNPAELCAGFDAADFPVATGGAE